MREAIGIIVGVVLFGLVYAVAIAAPRAEANPFSGTGVVTCVWTGTNTIVDADHFYDELPVSNWQEKKGTVSFLVQSTRQKVSIKEVSCIFERDA